MTPAADAMPLRVSLALFAGSGCSALIYELVWFQLLQLVVGSSAISLGILLATYMGGLGLGGLLLPRLVPARRHPFRVYALLELGIAALALLVLVEVPAVSALYAGSGSHGATGILLRAAIAGLCLVPPTLLMGATLPAIARGVSATPHGVGRLGALYAGNIAGGIAGCLLAGFHLLRFHDTTFATLVAVAINVTVALIAMAVARRRPVAAAAATAAGGTIEPDTSHRPGAAIVYAVIALSGLSALGGEVVWTRLLSLLLGPTVYTFSIILAVYLAGLAIGSAIGATVARASARPLRDLGAAQLLLAAGIAWAAYAVTRSLPAWPIAPPLVGDARIMFEVDLVRCAFALLPSTVLWGASFPLALAAARAGVDTGAGANGARDAARLVAGIYAANTAGAIAGALVFTFVGVPSWGTQGAQRVMVAIAALAGLVPLARAIVAPRVAPAFAARIAALAGAATLAALLVAGVPRTPSELIALGRYAAYRLGRGAAAPVGADPNVLYTGEGLTESVVVAQNGDVRLFHVSGKVEASTFPDDMRLQRMLGHIPALIHGHPRSVLIVGCGAGVTAGSFTLYPSVERIVICDIEPLVPTHVAPFFREQNYNVIGDPRVQVVYDDARHFVLTTKESFDVITSDPIHPWVRGSAMLYSRDYFELVRRHLNPGGVVSQWVPLYQAGEATVKGEMATFFSVFPNGTVWANRNRAGGYDVAMVATDGATHVDLDSLTARLERPDAARIARSLADLGWTSGVDLFATYAGRASDLGPWLAGAPINRDRRPWIQYQAGLESYTPQTADVFADMLAYRRFPRDVFAGSPALIEALKTRGGR
ncbi:MAG: SAM-dependent methyltransferase [Candidatus Eisenbacteria bacterium]|nr:SAM-dependent methyltransferase [Candidatus Eisenbacteria bacterium]